MKTTAILFAAILAGCATQPETPETHAYGTEHTVTVNFGSVGMRAVPGLAEAHCQKYGKHAQYAGKENLFVFYNCN